MPRAEQPGPSKRRLRDRDVDASGGVRPTSPPRLSTGAASLLRGAGSKARAWLQPIWVPDAAAPLYVQILLLVAYATCVLLREPGVVLQPRMWAEEATVYFAGALNAGPFAIVAPHQGYLSLFANAATFAATLVPRASAASVTTTFAFMGQMVPAFILVRSRSAAVAHPAARVLALACLAASPAATGEIWLNSINTQVFFTVSVALLAVDPGWSLTRGLALALMVLSSPVSGLLIPFFVMRAWVMRHAMAAAVPAAALALQVIAAISQRRPPKDVELSFYQWTSSMFRDQVWAAATGLAGSAPLGVLLILVLLLVAWCSRTPRAAVLAVMYLWLTVLSTWLSPAHGGGLRYASAPTVILALSLLSVITGAHSRWRLVAVAVLTCMLVSGIHLYSGGLGTAYDPAWPSWAQAVQQATEGRVRVWPMWANWFAELP